MAQPSPNPDEQRSKKQPEHEQVPEPLSAHNLHGTPYAYEVRKSELLQVITSDRISASNRISAARYLVRLSDRAATEECQEGIVARNYLATAHMIAGHFDDVLAVTEDTLRRIARSDVKLREKGAGIKDQLAAQVPRRC